MTTRIESVLVFAQKGPMLQGISLVLGVRRKLYRLSNEYLGILVKQHLHHNLSTRNLLCQCNNTALCYCMPCKLLRISYKSTMLFGRNMSHNPSSILLRWHQRIMCCYLSIRVLRWLKQWQMCCNMHFGNLFCGYYHWIMCYQLPFRVLSINSDKELREELYSWVFFGFDNWKLYYHM